MTTKAIRDAVDRINRNVRVQCLHRAKADLDLLINATPTGSARELLTEANIHLLRAEDELKKAGLL